MRWGLIGASTIASQYMINAIRKSGQSIDMVQSGNASHGEAFARTHNIETSVTDFDVLCKSAAIDAVYISSTNEKHFVQAMSAISSGKHVLCEKPLAINTKEAARMVKSASAANVVLATNHHLRNAGSHLAMKEIVATGAIGEVQSIRVFHAVKLPDALQGWRVNNPGAGGGVIADIVVHDADTVRFYLDEDPNEVFALSLSSEMSKGVEDSVMSIWAMPSGVMVQTHESFTHEFAKTGIEIHGTKGALIARDVMTQNPIGEVQLISKNGAKKVLFEDHNLYQRSVEKFSAAVIGEGAPAASGVDGVKSLAIAEAVAASANTHKSITVDYGDFT